MPGGHSCSGPEAGPTHGHEQVEHIPVTVSPEPARKRATGRVTIKEPTTTRCVVTLSSGKRSGTPPARQLKAGTYLVATYGASTSFKSSTWAKQTPTVAS